MNKVMDHASRARDIPEKIADHFYFCRTECVRYSRYGNLFARGTVRGQVALWDSDTKSLASVLGSRVAQSFAD